MSGDEFWKRLIVSCLTFSFSVFLTGLFVSSESSVNNEKATLMSTKQKKCVPADKDFKYRLLTEEKIAAPFAKANQSPENQDLKDCKTDKLQQSIEFRDSTGETENILYNPAVHKGQYQSLLYKEKCYESDGRK